jgi:hypothetical protein
MKSILHEMKKKIAIIESSLRSTIDEPYYIEIAIRDARHALDIYADRSRNLPDVTIYGSNVYASFDQEQIQDLLESFEQQSIEISETSLDELDEQNVTGAIAGYSTPNAFRKKPKKVGYASGLEESINTPPSFKYGEHQRPESQEETSQDKFPFSSDMKKWPNQVQEYPVKFTDNPYGTANIKDESEKVSIVAETMDRKYEQLIEGYRDFARNPKKSPEKTVKDTIKEIAKKLREIETLVNYNSKLKTESGITSSVYGPGTSKALTEISRRLIKISERVRSLGE